MDTVTFMKDAGVLSNKAMREVSELANHLDTLTADQLVAFTLMYSSSEMQSAIDVSDNVSKLENALIAKKKQFTAQHFATICSVVAFDDSHGQEESLTLKLPVFLHENYSRVLNWLTNESFTEYMQDFVHVAAAYISMYDNG